jgi:UDP-N-acetylmuramyl pentapeptide phosphotransferase/UDP-N-acetylglucosamine-1-phosphate transferase
MNGLAGDVAVLALFAFAYVALRVGDLAMFHICLMGAGAVLGFLIWNFPSGLIFLGDGGAYFVGVIIAVSAVLLVARNPQVSPWFPILALAYPVTETLFSVYRRWFVSHRGAGTADGLHLHSLVYRRLLSWMLSTRPGARHVVERNAMTTLYIWGLTLLGIIPAVLLYKRTYWLIGFTLLFAGIYLWLYSCIVRFRSPAWLRRLFSLGRLQRDAMQRQNP